MTNAPHLYPTLPRPRKGRVDKVEDGERQFLTIDGTRYATWLNLQHPYWGAIRPGARIEYQPYLTPWPNGHYSRIDAAYINRVAPFFGVPTTTDDFNAE